MSNTPQLGANLSPHGQRQYTRRSVNALGCIYLCGDSGGIVMNVSEGGLAVYSAVIPDLEAMPYLRFQLPQSADWIKARGKVAWSSEAQHAAGIQFVELPDCSRKQIREWITSQSGPSVESPRVEQRPQRATVPLSVPAPCAPGAIVDVISASQASSDTLESRLRALFVQREALLAQAAANKRKTPWGQRIALTGALAGISLLLGLAAARGKLGALVGSFTKASDGSSASAPSVSPVPTGNTLPRAADPAKPSAASLETEAQAPRITVTNQIYVPASYAQAHTSKTQNLQIGRVNHRVDPEYPPQAITHGIEGSVQLRASISATGAVESISVLRGPSMLTSPAVDAVRSWRYTPTLLDGKPIETQADIGIVFWLPPDVKANQPKN